MNIQNLIDCKKNLDDCDVKVFENPGKSFKFYLKTLKVDCFRHLNNIEIEFSHPVTAIAGSNRAGKTSLLLLMACSHEKFMKLDSTSSQVGLREHGWNDVLTFTSHETVNVDYKYKIEWRLAGNAHEGTAKRLHTSKAWSGLAKKSSDKDRINAKIRDRQVRLVDLDRLLPARAFSDSLYRKANSGIVNQLNADIAKAFSYIFSQPDCTISEIGTHINKRCHTISRPGQNTYSSYNAASGEEAVISLLRELIESPTNSLILIDEIEAGIHPSVLRKILDIVHIVSWRDKKQIIFTTHSPTALSAVNFKSRKFIDNSGGVSTCRAGISVQAASSKMDSVAYPILQIYCEDDLATFLISQQLVHLSKIDPYFNRLVNLVPSGPINEVKNDYIRHKRNFNFLRAKLGYCAIFDGDHRTHPNYSMYDANVKEFTTFIYPYEAPEKFLVKAYLADKPHAELNTMLIHTDHHALFDAMAGLGLATDAADARQACYGAFKNSVEYEKHSTDIQVLIRRAVSHFEAQPD